MSQKKIVCWIGDSPNHRAFIHKISKEFKIDGIVIDKKSIVNKEITIAGVLPKIIDKIRFWKIDRAWNSLKNHYAKNYRIPPETEIFVVDSINSDQVVEFTTKLSPDLVLVSGTSVIKEPLLTMKFSIGIVNLHTGLSPYLKGGPNCTNWCIANKQWPLIGNSVLWLSAGIDSGNLIASETTNLSDASTLFDIHLKVMEHAHNLYLRAIRYLLNTDPPHQSVPQIHLGKGTLYFNKMWTSKQKRLLLKNLKDSRDFDCSFEIKTVPLPA